MARRLLPPIVAVLLVVVLAAPARAIGAFGPPVEVLDPPCAFDFFTGDAAQDAGGDAHGFVEFFGGTCGSEPRIQYFEGSGTTWTYEETPYFGDVLAAAEDATGTYLLYDHPETGVRITKRLADGTYTAGRTLAAGVADQVVAVQGDLVATGGQWWAVWTEQVGPGGESAQTDLFQGHTIGGAPVNRQRITTSRQADAWPALALRPGTTFPLTLIWERAVDEFTADLRRAAGNASGAWSSSTFASLGSLNTTPDVQVVGTTTYVTWWRDRRIVAADNAGGPFVSHTFESPGFIRPRIAVSSDVVLVGWTRALADTRTFVAARQDGTWRGSYASPAVSGRDQYLFGVAPAGGLATALNVSLGNRLYATTEASAG